MPKLSQRYDKGMEDNDFDPEMPKLLPRGRATKGATDLLIGRTRMARKGTSAGKTQHLSHQLMTAKPTYLKG